LSTNSLTITSATPIINLSAIAAGAGGFVINGQCAGDSNGFAVTNAGDVNGDGLDDLLVAAIGAQNTAGRNYVVFGQTGTTAINLSAVAAGTGGFVINGECANDASGSGISGVGDINGDGLADVLIGAKWANNGATVDAGRSYVVYGKTSTSAVNFARSSGVFAALLAGMLFSRGVWGGWWKVKGAQWQEGAGARARCVRLRSHLPDHHLHERVDVRSLLRGGAQQPQLRGHVAPNGLGLAQLVLLPALCHHQHGHLAHGEGASRLRGVELVALGGAVHHLECVAHLLEGRARGGKHEADGLREALAVEV
jgi:hypothetical protein